MNLQFGAIIAVTLLSGCASRPWTCLGRAWPPEFKSHESGWQHLATVCETGIARDLFTWQAGTLLSITVRDADDAVLVSREVFFRDQDRVDLTAQWDSESLLSVRVFDKADGKDGPKVKIADFEVRLPGP